VVVVAGAARSTAARRDRRLLPLGDGDTGPRARAIGTADGEQVRVIEDDGHNFQPTQPNSGSSGHHPKLLTTPAVEVDLVIPKLSARSTRRCGR
jgi:hypothetical protein